MNENNDAMSGGINQRILLVEDELSLARVYEEYLRDEPYEIVHVDTGAKALQEIGTGNLDAMVLDLRLPDMNGLEILEHVQAKVPDFSVVVITAHGSINTAVKAMQFGAADFLLKPFDPERLIYTLRNTLERQKLSTIVQTFQNAFDRREYEGFIGSSLIMQTIYKTIDAAGSSSASVFITGESGTGKEVCAEALHARSKRHDKPFIALNCAAIPHDLMESEIFGHVKGAFTGAVADRDGAASRADGGTLFLDEICEMDQGLQAKLLRFIQTGTFQKVGGSSTEKVDVRFICATNKEPWAEVEAGNFREDLYFRLHVVPIALPPLRERNGDILEIAASFLQQYAHEEGKQFSGFDAEVEDAIRRHPWPGNVRELQNTLRNAVVLNEGNVITLEMIPQLAGTATAAGKTTMPADQAIAPSQDGSATTRAVTDGTIEPLWKVEHDHIQRALEACEGNVSRAAALLEIGTSTLYRRLKELKEVR